MSLFRRLRTLSLYFAIPALGAASPLLVLPAITGRFGADAWAVVAAAQSIGAAGAIVAELGWGVVGPQLIAGTQESGRGEVYRRSLASKLVTSSAMMPIVAVAIFFIAPEYRWEAVVLAIGATFNALSQSWFFIGAGQPFRVMFSESLPRVVVSIGSAVAIFAGAPLMTYSVAILLVIPVILILSRRLIGPSAGIGRGDFRGVGTTVRRQAVIASGRAVSVVYTALPAALVLAVAPSAAPLFSAVDRLLRMTLTLLQGVPSRLQSWIGSSTGDDRRSRSRRSLLYNSILGAVFGVGFGVVVPFAAPLIFAGTIDVPFAASFAGGALIAAICSSRGFGLSLVSKGLANTITLAIICASIAGLASIAPLAIAVGAVGALLGQLIAELVGIAAQGFFLRRTARDDDVL